MRYILFAVPIMLAALQPAQAQWCAHYRGGGNNCGFRTFEQCQQSISGVGGYCNSDSSGPAVTRQPPRVDRSEREINRRAATRPVRPPRAKEAERHRERPAREKPSKEKPAVVFAVGDDEHIVPAEPEDDQAAQPLQAERPSAESETMVTPAGSGARGSDFIAARDLVLSGNYQAGLAALQALNQDSDPDVAAYTGYAHAKLGQRAEAKSWYEKALAVDPNHLWALSYYGLLLVEEGNLPAARENLEKIRTICGGTGCYPYSSLQAAITPRR